jgi:hypothetical protein
MQHADVERLSGAMQATNAAPIVVMGQVATLRAQGRRGAAAALSRTCCTCWPA